MDSKGLRKKIGKNIRMLRQTTGLPLEDFASALGITSGFLGLVERGHRGFSLEHLMHMCNIFSISMDELIGFTVKEKSKDEQYLLSVIRVYGFTTENDIAYLVSFMDQSKQWRENRLGGDTDGKSG